MAIAFVSGAVNQSTSNVATLTATLSPVNGNLVCVFLNTAAAVTATTCVDSNAVALTAGPTITNTLMMQSFYYTVKGSPTNFKCTWTTARQCSIAAVQYSGCNFQSVNANLAVKTNSGTSATATIAPTIDEANDFIVACLGAANSLTATVGTTRDSTTTSTARVNVIDNTSASVGAVTCTATLTSAAWTAVALEIRTAYQNPLSDTITFSDAKALGFGLIIPGDQITFSDGASVGVPINLTMSDAITLTDGTRQPLTMDFLLSIQCPHLNNWLDAFAGTLGAGTTQLTLTLSDDGESNWADSLGLGYGNIIGDSITLADQLGAGYGSALSDQLILVDSLGAGYGAQLSDSLNNWLDAAVMLFGYGLALSDNLNNWLDALALGYGNAFSDTLTFSDQLGAGYGSAMSDQIVMVDSLGAGYGAQLTDSLNFWADVVVFGMSIALTLTDNLSTWADSLGVGYGNAVNDTLVFSDRLGAGYGSAFSDQLILVDSLGAGYGAQLSDNLNSWQDVITFLLSIAVTITDSMNSWVDALAIGYGNQITDQLTLVDFLGAGYGSSMSDQLVITDSMNAGYGAQFSDSLNNWLDVLKTNLSFNMLLTDNLNNWLDTLGVGYGFAINDALSLSDQLGAGYGAVFSDQLVVVDSLGAGYGFLLSDSLNNWLDSFISALGGGNLIQLQLSDTLNFWTDFMAAGYGMAASDQLILTDSTGLGYGAQLSDNLNNWLDAVNKSLSIAVTLTDAMNWQDSVSVGYGLVLTDDANNWQDFLPAFLVAYNIVISDGFLLTDQISYASVLGLQLADSMNFWSDLATELLGIAFAVSDQFTITDSMMAGYGMAISDQVVMVDSLGAGYGFKLSDTMNFWSDAFVLSLIGTMLSLNLSDTMNFWGESLGAGYGNMLSDQFFYTDSMLVGYGLVVTDNANNWADFLPSFTIAYSIAISDGFLLSDQFSYSSVLGLQLTDSINFWSEAFAAGAGTVITISVTVVDLMNFWDDAIVAAFGHQFSGSKLRAARTTARIQFNYTGVLQKIRSRGVQVIQQKQVVNYVEVR